MHIRIFNNPKSRNLKGIATGLEISGFGIVQYSVRSESGRIITLRDQAYYVPGLPNDSRIISPQGICTSEGSKGTFIAHFNDENDSYAVLNLKEDNPGWYKTKPVEKFYANYKPKNSLPTNEATLPNQREK